MSLSNKLILMILTNHSSIVDSAHSTGVWLEEFVVPYLAFRAQGAHITVASPQGGSVPIDPHSEASVEPSADVVAACAVLQDTFALSEVSAAPFDAVFLPGGHGTMFDLPNNETLQRLLADFADTGKVIGAVCHGPAGLVGIRLSNGQPLVAGKTITAFTNAEEQAAGFNHLMPFLLETRLRELGGRFIVWPKWSKHVERDGNLITGQNPQSSAAVAQAIIEALNA